MKHFLDGLTYQERRLLNAACGGLIMAQEPDVAKEVIKKMAKDSQQFSQRRRKPSVNAINAHNNNNATLEPIMQQLEAITSFMQNMNYP